MITRRRLGEMLAAIAIGAVQPAAAQNLAPRAGGGALGASSGPKQVLLIRHGEKLGSGDRDEDGGPNLSLRGSARAMALPSLFSPATPQARLRSRRRRERGYRHLQHSRHLG